MDDDKILQGLISKGYVTRVQNYEKPKEYLLTLKGCVLAVGYEFDDLDLNCFIENASKNHLYFAYINSILNKTSTSYVRKIFIDPIRDLLNQGIIQFDKNIIYFTSVIAESSGWSLTQNLKDEFRKELINNTYYSSKRRKDWKQFMIEHFYKNSKSEEFYHLNCSEKNESVGL